MKKSFVVLIMAALAVSSAFCSVWVTSSTKLTNAAAHTLTARYLGGTLSCTAGGLDLGSPSYDTAKTLYTASGVAETSYTLAWQTSSGSVTPSSYQWYKNNVGYIYKRILCSVFFKPTFIPTNSHSYRHSYRQIVIHTDIHTDK